MCQTGIFHGLHAILCKIERLTTILWKLGNMCTLRQRNGRIYTIRRLKGFDELNVFCKCDYMPRLRYDATANTLTDKNLLRFLLNGFPFSTAGPNPL
jgi:hypothetical protein